MSKKKEKVANLNVDEASKLAAEKRMAKAAAKPVAEKASKVPAYAQGECQAKAAEMLKQAEEVYGRKPTPEEKVLIKKAVHDGRDPELPAPIPSKEEQKKARIAELLEKNTRRDLEEIARDVGLDPTKAQYPDMTVLAEAIADKEAEEA